eukprot:TRINITY_DN3040_c0_g3_i2.p1 TRINITY_DN3040_c0_g3~~TRINITY_DN3040_c0_g3_i2.p1  ORF type:complete len:488 (-),score=146.77 TRINITY_DN3040_c0_g3_i2:536-1999(-)
MGCASSAPSVTGTTRVDNIFDEFRSVKLLGKGASSEVLLVQHHASKNLYAMKKMEKADPQSAEMFEQEVKVLQKLSHPNIVQFFNSYECEDYFYIVTQFLQGGEFFDRLSKLKHYSEKQAAVMAKRMLQAIAYCHKNNIVHRDLKPENYVFDTEAPDSEMKLIDFGCARVVVDTERYTDMAGTPYYIAPEMLKADVVRNGRVLKACDMWSLGVIFYIMVTGLPPFNGNDDASIMRAVLHGKYHWPRNARVSDSLKDLISRLLNEKPLERLTALQALEHPWIAGLESNSDVPLDAVVASLSEFNKSTKIKRAVARLLVNHMTETDVKQLAEVFAQLDTDGDGHLDAQEIARYMKKLFNYDDATAHKQAEAFLSEIDHDNNGKIDVQEFQAAHMRGQLSTNEEAMRKAFQSIDENNDGFLDSKEIAKLVEQNGNVGQAVKEMIAEVDKNGDGQISFEEFLEAMKRDSSVAPGARPPGVNSDAKRKKKPA